MINDYHSKLDAKKLPEISFLQLQSTICRPPYCPPLLKLSNSMLNMCSELAKWNLKHICTVYIVFGHSNGPCDFFGINYKSNRFWKFLKNESTPPETLQNSFGLKKSTKSATTLIFFPVKAEMLLFSNFTLGGHPVSNFGFERHHNFEKKSKFSKFQNKIGYPVSTLVSTRC